MKLTINIVPSKGEKAPIEVHELVRKIDAELASIEGINDWTIETDNTSWVWTEDGGQWVAK